MNEASYWFRAIPDEQRFGTLTKDQRADVVIIGGGIAGLSAAYFLARAGSKVVLLEMNTVASGDSGFTTALLTRFLDSAETSIAAWEASATSLALLEQVIAEEKIACDWQRVDSIGFTQNSAPAAQEHFAQAVSLLQAKDPTVEFLAKKEATLAVGIPVAAAYRKKGSEGRFHSRQFLLGLAERAVKIGARIFEQSEVTHIEPGESVVVKTAGGKITADRLIIATGIPPKQFFPKVVEKLTAAVTYVIDVQFADYKPFPNVLLWDDLDPFHYFRWVSSSELLLGGEDWIMKNKKPAANPHIKLEEWLTNACGQNNFRVVNKWQGTIFSTPDALPYVGSDPAYGKNIIFLTGWGGNGMTLGFLSGTLAADMLQQKKNPYQKLFSFNR